MRRTSLRSAVVGPCTAIAVMAVGLVATPGPASGKGPPSPVAIGDISTQGPVGYRDEFVDLPSGS
jgi:hypothetical protein